MSWVLTDNKTQKEFLTNDTEADIMGGESRVLGWEVKDDLEPLMMGWKIKFQAAITSIHAKAYEKTRSVSSYMTYNLEPYVKYWCL